MAITVAELVNLPLLGIKLHAGATGLDRLVSWAHTCELSNPWDWMGPDDLLMTNGLGIPADTRGQVEYVEKLASSGLSALLIGEGHEAPPLTGGMLEAAERLGLPILLNAYEVQFIAVARAVADANRREEQSRLNQTMRLYDLVRSAAVEGKRGSDLIARLAYELNVRLSVVDPIHGTPLMDGGFEGRPELCSELVQVIAKHNGSVVSVVRLYSGEKPAVVVPIPTKHPAMLIAESSIEGKPGLALLQHAALIAAMELEKISLDRETLRSSGSKLFASILEGRMDPAVGSDRLGDYAFDGEGLVVVASQLSSEHLDELDRSLTSQGVPHLLLSQGAIVLILTCADPEPVVDTLGGIAKGGHTGASNVIRGLGAVSDATKEARWALSAANSADRDSVNYGEIAPQFMPQTISEARDAVDRVLGNLVDYDRKHKTDLLPSLKIFLECNRSWKQSAEVLNVHTQTVVYRMRRVREITGRSLDSTADVAELWFALEAYEATKSTASEGDRAHEIAQ